MSSKPKRKFAIRKIMVALESSDHSLAALEAAAQLAALLQAELHGLFVQDINLLRLAELPIAHYVPMHTGVGEQLNPVIVGRALRAQASHLRQRLAGVADRARVSYTFRSVQGHVADELLSAAREADLLIVGRACASKRRAPLGSTARAAARRSAPSVLVVRRGVAFREPLMVVYEDSRAGAKTLGVAMELAAAVEHPLSVLVVAEGEKNGPDIEKHVAGLIDTGPGESSTVRVADLQGLLSLLEKAAEGTLFISANSPLLEGEGGLRLLNAIDIPVFLIR